MPPNKLSPKVRRIVIGIGEQIRSERLAAALSQEAMADRVGMTRPNFARIEYGKTNLTIETLTRIADALGLELVIRFEPVRKRRTP